MKIDRYPPQEPLSPLGAKYHERVLALGQGIDGEEASYGPDPYQSLAVFRAAQPTGDTLVFLIKYLMPRIMNVKERLLQKLERRGR